MRVIFGVLGLLIVVAIVGMLAKKQLSSVTAPLPNAVAPAGGAVAPAATPKEQVQQFQKGVQDAVQQARPVDDTKQ